MSDFRSKARDLASQYASTDDALGWFDRLYTTAGGDAATIPWADLQPNGYFVEWAESHGLSGDDGRRKALVCGCGLGDDAEALSTIGFDVTAFDISPAAIEWAKRRFATSRVSYVVANLLSPPADWIGKFDFILEAYTLQVLPSEMQTAAMKSMARLVAPGGSILLIARGRDEHAPRGLDFRWPLSRVDLKVLKECGLREDSFEDLLEDADPPVRRFRAVYSRA
jgi:SAM-dependent methyltransferase